MSVVSLSVFTASVTLVSLKTRYIEMPNLSTAKKTAHVVAHKRQKLKQKQDAEEARWEELEEQRKLSKQKERKIYIDREISTTEQREEATSESTTTTTAITEPTPEDKTEVVSLKKRERNPNLSNLIANSKKQKEIKISHVSSVPQNANLKLNVNAFDVLSSGSSSSGSKKKKKKGNKRGRGD